MEKLIFWEGCERIETVGSMDEIEGMMDSNIAYRVLRGCCYNREKYKTLNHTVEQIMDHKACSLNCPPLDAAIKIDASDTLLPVPPDIVCFLEKAYLDGYEMIGDRECAFFLGRLYSEERYGQIDYPRAVKWFEAGARAGDGEAEAMLGKCYLLGLGVEKNYELAFQYLVKWALISKENTQALYLLADMFYEGLYVQQDLAQAHELYQKAWKAEDAGYCIAGVQALLRLADYRLERIGEKEDCHYAFASYQRAESDSYDFLLSHPEEAAQCALRAQEGQEKARRKLKKLISQMV